MVESRMAELKEGRETARVVVNGLMDRLEVIKVQLKEMQEQSKQKWDEVRVQLNAMGQMTLARKKLGEEKEQTTVGRGESWLARDNGVRVDDSGKSLSKLEFPDFDGSNLKDWIYGSERHFELERVEEEKKVRLASIHMFGKALQWHFTYIRNRGRPEMPLWSEYIESLKKRFGKTSFEVPMGLLKTISSEANCCSTMERRGIDDVRGNEGDVQEAVGMDVDDRFDAIVVGSSLQISYVKKPNRSVTWVDGKVNPAEIEDLHHIKKLEENGEHPILFKVDHVQDGEHLMWLLSVEACASALSKAEEVVASISKAGLIVLFWPQVLNEGVLRDHTLYGYPPPIHVHYVVHDKVVVEVDQHWLQRVMMVQLMWFLLMEVDSSILADSEHDRDSAVQNGPSDPSEQPAESSLGGGGEGSGSQSHQVQFPVATQQSPVIGPRPAPTYSVVNAILEKKEDGPGPRCGHTLTAVAAVGEEGTPGYIGPKLILFGGATALKGNFAASGAPSSAGSVGIRLASATAAVHCYDVLTNKLSRITPFGEPPTLRAAHVATAVGTMVVIQGGIGPVGLSAEDLHVLDLTQQRPRWHRVVVQGPGPGPRYGHVMALVGQRYLMAIGGNDGKRPMADVCALDTAAKPYEWRKLKPEGEGPPPCMYATASARSDGLLVPCGGRDANSVPLATAYGLAKHRDERWEWVIAPGVSPSSRYQHAAIFVNARLHVFGGALGGERMVEGSSGVAALDTAASELVDTKPTKYAVTSPRTGRYSVDAAGNDDAFELTRRYRHVAAAAGDLISIYGGLCCGVLLNDQLVAEDLAAAEITQAASLAAGATQSMLLSRRYGYLDERIGQMAEALPDGAVALGNLVAPPVNEDIYTVISTKNAMLPGSRQMSTGVEDGKAGKQGGNKILTIRSDSTEDDATWEFCLICGEVPGCTLEDKCVQMGENLMQGNERGCYAGAVAMQEPDDPC